MDPVNGSILRECSEGEGSIGGGGMFPKLAWCAEQRFGDIDLKVTVVESFAMRLHGCD